MSWRPPSHAGLLERAERRRSCPRTTSPPRTGSLLGEDESFPCVFPRTRRASADKFIKVLFVNSLEPGLKFVYPYPPTERLAATLRAETDIADAAVYDPNLEAPAIIRSFPDTPLRLLSVVEQEAPDFIVQAVFNVDHDLRLLCALRARVRRRVYFIGGPHLQRPTLRRGCGHCQWMASSLAKAASHCWRW
jgi:hypothetical protein